LNIRRIFICLFFLVYRTTRLPSNQYDLRVTLSCWANYTFRVIAFNRVGASDPSPISESMCSTSTCRPRSNPVGVRAYTTQFIPLLIEWDVRKRNYFLIALKFIFIYNNRVCHQ
jgi:hypothetical protein